jgi:hypothetical protein
VHNKEEKNPHKILRIALSGLYRLSRFWGGGRNCVVVKNKKKKKK